MASLRGIFEATGGVITNPNSLLVTPSENVRTKYYLRVVTVARCSPHISLYARYPPLSEEYEHDTPRLSY
jgi:hypothetical protein